MSLPPRPPPRKPQPALPARFMPFSIQLSPAVRLGTPVTAMAEIEAREAKSGTGWSSLEIGRNEFHLKVGNGDKVYADFKLLSLPGHDHILRNIKFNCQGTLKIGVQLKGFDQLLYHNAYPTDAITLFQFDGDNYLTFFTGNNPTTHRLPIQQLSENFDTGFDMRLLDHIVRVTIKASRLIKYLQNWLSDNSQDEKPVTIEVTQYTVNFSTDQGFSFTYSPLLSECIIEMPGLAATYRATFRGMNKKALLYICTLGDKAQLEFYRNPDSLVTSKSYRVSDPFITLSFQIEPSASSSSSSSNIFFGNPNVPPNIGSMMFVYYLDSFSVELDRQPVLQGLEMASQGSDKEVTEVFNIPN